MANKAVFLDRDHTIIEDPGYLSDPGAVKLLPGAELAIKSLAQAGYMRVVVTNQSGVARSLLTEEALETIHAEMRRQLAENGAHLDAIYYCPYHPEGNVPEFARDSDLRKPKPGMLLKAAEELDIDLRASWMVGDSPRDIEAGQRAGCRTVRVRVKSPHSVGEEGDEDVQADYTVRNLVDAARVILRESSRPTPAPAAARAGGPAEASPPQVRSTSQTVPPEPPDDDEPPAESMGQAEVLREILRHLRQLVRRHETEEFSLSKLAGGIFQVLAAAALILVLWKMIGAGPPEQAIVWGVVAGVLQVMALTFFVMRRNG